jgi:two-component system sensor histidine kinase/response regulator
LAIDVLSGQMPDSPADLKTAEENRRSLVSLLETTLEATADGILVIDREGKVALHNKKFAEMWGIPEELLRSKDDRKLLEYVRDRLRYPEAFLQKVQFLYDRPEVESFDTIHLRDGSIFERFSKPQRLGSEIIGRVWSFQDVTERWLAEEALHLTQFSLERASDAIFWTDRDARFINANEAACRSLGYSRDEILRLRVPDIDPNFTAERWPSHWEQIRRDGAFTFETVHRAKDGTEFPVEINVNFLEHSGREYNFAFARNISERKRVEKALRESEEKFRSISASAKDAIILMDDGGAISYWNPSAEKILGYTMAEALGKNLHDLLAPEECRGPSASAIPSWREAGQGTATGKTIELKARRKDGAEIDAELSLSSARLEDRWSTIGILRDITGRKEAERAMREARDAAEAARREVEIANRSLEETNRTANRLAMEAVAASRAKSDFVANMSHEMRTPMNAVIGMTGLLLDTELTDEQREYADTVRTSADALLTLINDILDFSKIEAGKLVLESLDFDLRILIEDLLDLLGLRAFEKSLELVCSIDPRVPTLLQGDPGRLRQVLINLLNNAIKFTQKGMVLLRIEVESKVGNIVRIRFEVRDTGIGIPEDKRSCLFQAFSQVDPSRTRKYGGTGLGLAISKSLVDLLGGEIGCKSVEGEGSTFWFTAVFEAQEGEIDGILLGEATAAGQRILVADDCTAARSAIEEMLASSGCAVEGVAGGGAAIARLREASEAGTPFTLALIDAEMPELDGIETARRIREDPLLQDLALVLMAAPGRHPPKEVLKKVGAIAALIKPVKYTRLRGYLGQAGGPMPQGSQKGTGTALPRIGSHGGRQKVRILVADDNMTNQLVAVRILEKLGFRADAVGNGKEAVQALQTIPYDLVLMDVQMPVMDGFEAARAIRGLERETGLHIPIIAMTAHARKEDREGCLEAGMDDYLSKPVQPKDLLESIRKNLAPVEERKASASERSGSTFPEG